MTEKQCFHSTSTDFINASISPSAMSLATVQLLFRSTLTKGTNTAEYSSNRSEKFVNEPTSGHKFLFPVTRYCINNVAWDEMKDTLIHRMIKELIMLLSSYSHIDLIYRMREYLLLKPATPIFQQLFSSKPKPTFSETDLHPRRLTFLRG